MSFLFLHLLHAFSQNAEHDQVNRPYLLVLALLQSTTTAVNLTTKHPNPNPDSTWINCLHTMNMKMQDPPLWRWKGLKLTTNSGKSYSIADFLRENFPKLEESVLGPGAGAGVGCGVGVGVGLVAGMGFVGSAWNHARITFGFGIGCGIGAGFGFGQGFGFGSSLETLKSRIVTPSPGS